jgi:hypothetical protein
MITDQGLKNDQSPYTARLTTWDFGETEGLGITFDTYTDEVSPFNIYFSINEIGAISQLLKVDLHINVKTGNALIWQLDFALPSESATGRGGHAVCLNDDKSWLFFGGMAGPFHALISRVDPLTGIPDSALMQ